MATKVVLRAQAMRTRLATRGMTQASLAAACELDLRTIQRWFSGQRVRLDYAERAAKALACGTAELFDGAPKHDLGDTLTRLRAMHRALSARDGAVAQALRVLQLNHGYLLDRLRFSHHPNQGYVFRWELERMPLHKFVMMRVRPEGPPCTMALENVVARSLRFERARIWVQASSVCLLESVLVRSVACERREDGSFDLWLWRGADVREVVLVSERDLRVECAVAEPVDVLDLDLPANRHALCVRPTAPQLEAAGAAPGFDLLVPRAGGRVDFPVQGLTWPRALEGR